VRAGLPHSCPANSWTLYPTSPTVPPPICPNWWASTIAVSRSVSSRKGVFRVGPRRPDLSARRISQNRDDIELAAGNPDEPFYIVWIACENRGLLAKASCHHDSINDIRGSSHAKQPPCFVRPALAKRNDRAPHQEAPELGLSRGPANLGDHWWSERRISHQLPTEAPERPILLYAYMWTKSCCR